MRFRSTLFAIALLLLPCAARADLCEGLKPQSGRDDTRQIDEKITRAAPVGQGSDVNVTYTEVSKDVLKDYPNADVTYLKERILFLFCVAIEKSSLNDSDKIDRIQRLWDETYPPDSRGAAMPRCTPGKAVPTDDEHIHLRLVAVRYNDAVKSIVDSGRPLVKGIRAALNAGRVARFGGTNSAIIRISKVATDQTPSLVPFLTKEEGICSRMLAMRRMPDGVLMVSAPILGEKDQSVSAIVLPRRMFENSPDAQVCIEPSFHIVYRSDTRQNVYCDKGSAAGASQTVLRGNPRRAYFLIQGPSHLALPLLRTVPPQSGAKPSAKRRDVSPDPRRPR